MNDKSDNEDTKKSPLGDIGVHSFVFNPVQENTYLIWDETDECVIVDAGCYTQKEFEKINGFIILNNLKPVKLINTHCHFDHLFGIEKCRKAYNLNWEAHPGDSFLIKNAPLQAAMFGISFDLITSPIIELSDGDKILFGNSCLKVLHVPGHSPGSVCFYEEKSKILITGDVLFNGSIGRTDLPGGDYETLIKGIHSKLLVLPDDVYVFPGHGPATTIGDEKIRNPFLK
jgi:glyoxylase-like metal-dependent hydrolase (beta-lactamase superfamily II)